MLIVNTVGVVAPVTAGKSDADIACLSRCDLCGNLILNMRDYPYELTEIIMRHNIEYNPHTGYCFNVGIRCSLK